MNNWAGACLTKDVLGRNLSNQGSTRQEPVEPRNYWAGACLTKELLGRSLSNQGITGQEPV
jgi:hypothetical protein